jgi:hypothetical protein
MVKIVFNYGDKDKERNGNTLGCWYNLTIFRGFGVGDNIAKFRTIPYLRKRRIGLALNGLGGEKRR